MKQTKRALIILLEKLFFCFMLCPEVYGIFSARNSGENIPDCPFFDHFKISPSAFCKEDTRRKKSLDITGTL